MSEGSWDDGAAVYGRGSFGSYVKGLGVAVGGAAVTPSDTVDLAFVARLLYVGVGGDLKVAAVNGDVLIFVGLPAGTILPVAVKRVYATGQPGAIAASIVALK